jgi:signal transduction histidine kinase
MVKKRPVTKFSTAANRVPPTDPHLEPTGFDSGRLDREEIDRLKRQVIALQRISSIGILAGGICHELNNALTPIMSYAKLGLRNPDSTYRDRVLQKILDGGERVSQITRGMLGLARPGLDDAHRETRDLIRLLEDVILLVSKDLARNRVRLETHFAGRLHARINPPQIQQVLINLLINARQAMPDGGVVELRLDRDPAGQHAELSVIDRGAGISPEDLPRIFEPFFSTKSAPDSAGMGGTGLGLAVCRDIVESHHGRIRVRSRPGEGSTFTLILPLALPAAEPPQPSQNAA